MPGIVTRLPIDDWPEAAAPPVVALTFDACGGRQGTSYDAELIAFLRKHQIPATLFVSSLWLRVNASVIKELAADPLFEIAAHGARHKPCSVTGARAYGIQGTESIRELVMEVEGNVRALTLAAGGRPRWFRSGTAHYGSTSVFETTRIQMAQERVN